MTGVSLSSEDSAPPSVLSRSALVDIALVFFFLLFPPLPLRPTFLERLRLGGLGLLLLLLLEDDEAEEKDDVGESGGGGQDGGGGSASACFNCSRVLLLLDFFVLEDDDGVDEVDVVVGSWSSISSEAETDASTS